MCPSFSRCLHSLPPASLELIRFSSHQTPIKIQFNHSQVILTRHTAMRFFTGFFGFCVTLTALLAGPAGSQEARNLQSTSVGTAEVAVRDWMSDIIKIILGVEVGELLSEIDRSLKALNAFITEAMITLNQIKAKLDAGTRTTLERLVETALTNAQDTTNPITSDLELVLPAISNRAIKLQRNGGDDGSVSQLHFSDAADLIQAILGISLESLLTKIAEALEMCDELLVRTMQEIASLANTISDPQVAAELNEASVWYLTHGRGVIRPVLDSLYKVLPSRSTPKAQGMLSDIMSGILQFDLVEAANAFSKSWYVDMRGILEESVEELHSIPRIPEEVEDSIKEIIGSSVASIKRTIYPLIHVLVHFVSHNGRGNYQLDNDLPRDIINSLLGVSLADFISYVDFSLERSRFIVNSSRTEITDLAQNETGPLVAFRIDSWVDGTFDKLVAALEPFMSIVSPILPPESGLPRNWVASPVEFLKSRSENTLCDFSLKTGKNKALVINMISELLDFDISEGTTVLLRSMSDVREVLTAEMNKLAGILEPDVMQKVSNIVDNAVNETRDAIQPGLDVFLLFSSQMTGRHDKDVLADVVRTFSSVSYQNFALYMAYVVDRVNKLVTSTSLSIHEVVALSSSSPQIADVDVVLNETASLTASAVEPFVNVILPLLHGADAL